MGKSETVRFRRMWSCRVDDDVLSVSILSKMSNNSGIFGRPRRRSSWYSLWDVRRCLEMHSDRKQPIEHDCWIASWNLCWSAFRSFAKTCGMCRQEGSLKEEKRKFSVNDSDILERKKTGTFPREVKVHVTNVLNTARIWMSMWSFCSMMYTKDECLLKVLKRLSIITAIFIPRSLLKFSHLRCYVSMRWLYFVAS